MITKRIVANVITFFIIATVMIFLLIVTIFRVTPKYAVDATFRDSGGVFTGQEVTYRGVTVGRVGTMTVVPQGVRINLVIEKRWNKIPADAKARVMFKSAVGEQFVDLLPQSDKPPYFKDRDTIPVERTELPIQQEDLLRLLDAVLSGIPPKAIGDLVNTLGTGLGGRGQKLHLALGALDPITQVLANRADDLNRIAVNGDKAGTAFDSSAKDFVAGADSLATVSQALASGSGNLTRVLQNGSTAVPELASLINARKTQLDATIANLATVTRISFDRIKSVDATLHWLPVFLQAIVNAYDPATRVIRFGLVTDQPNPAPCQYGTPRRDTSARGDASGQPHTENFAQPCSALAASAGTPGLSSATPLGPAAPSPAAPAGIPGPGTGLGSWVRVLSDTLPVR